MVDVSLLKPLKDREVEYAPEEISHIKYNRYSSASGTQQEKCYSSVNSIYCNTSPDRLKRMALHEAI